MPLEQKLRLLGNKRLGTRVTINTTVPSIVRMWTNANSPPKKYLILSATDSIPIVYTVQVLKALVFREFFRPDNLLFLGVQRSRI